MNLNNPDSMRDRAIEYCIEHVYGWEELSEEAQADYLRNVMKPFLEDAELKKQFFASQLN